MSDRRRSKRWIWAWIAVGTPGVAVVGSLFVVSRRVPYTTVTHVTLFDVLARPVETIAIRVRLREGFALNDAPGESVTFRLPGAEPVTVLTDEHGIATAETRFDDPGDHRVPLLLPARFREPVPRLPLAYGSPSTGWNIRVFVRTDDAPIALCIVEPTLRPSAPWHVEQQVAGPATAPPGSIGTLGRLARTRLIVYITLDTNMRLNATRRWLVENGYPAGPLLGWGGATRTSSFGTAASERIERLNAAWRHIDFALVGNTAAARTFHAVGIRSYLVGAEAVPDRSLPDSVTTVPNWTALDQALTGTD